MSQFSSSTMLVLGLNSGLLAREKCFYPLNYSTGLCWFCLFVFNVATYACKMFLFNPLLLDS